jgi:hypothetical protein
MPSLPGIVVLVEIASIAHNGHAHALTTKRDAFSLCSHYSQNAVEKTEFIRIISSSLSISLNHGEKTSSF